MSTFLTILHVVICLVLIGVVLLQSGREGGGDIGGGGGGGGLKPVQSGNKFMERLTSTMAVIFMITSIVLAAQGAGTSVMQGEKSDAPAAVGGDVKKDEAATTAVELDDKAKEEAPAGDAKAPAAGDSQAAPPAAAPAASDESKNEEN